MTALPANACAVVEAESGVFEGIALTQGVAVDCQRRVRHEQPAEKYVALSYNIFGVLDGPTLLVLVPSFCLTGVNVHFSTLSCCKARLWGLKACWFKMRELL